MIKYIFIAIAVAIVVIGGIFLIVMNATSGLTDTADNFFKAVTNNEYNKAYSYLSKEFQTKTSPEDLKERLVNSEIINYVSANWHSRSFENNIGKLEGEIRTLNGATIPVNLVLVKENDGWKINSIDKLESGFGNINDKKNPKIPGVDQLKKMTNEIILALGNSINIRDFSEFLAVISKTWSNQTNSEELRKSFKSFEEKNIDLTKFANSIEPVFDKVPIIADDGLLVIEGLYPEKNYNFIFKLKFLYEHPLWKLISINIKTE